MSQPKIVEFGPVRVVGISYVGQNQNNEIPEMWGKQIIPREKEIDKVEPVTAYGVCRCLPKDKAPATGHAFEYIGGVHATPTASIPGGMTEVNIPRGHYIVIEAANLQDIGRAWSSIGETVAKFPDWEPYCSPKRCECATHPHFEYYPPGFTPEKPLFIYIPVEKK